MGFLEGYIVRRLPHDVPLFPVLEAIAAFIEEHGPLTPPQDGITRVLVDHATAGQDLPARLVDTLTRIEASTDPEATPAPTSASMHEGEPHPDWPPSTPVPAADTLEGQIVRRLSHDVPLSPVLEMMAGLIDRFGPLNPPQEAIMLALVDYATAGQDLPGLLFETLIRVPASTEPEPTSGLPCSDCEASAAELWIADTQGVGVASRNDCRDAARTGRRGLAEGTRVNRIASGTDRCSGWSYVTSGAWSGWVRDRYLSDAPPPTPITLERELWPTLPMEFCTLPLNPEHAARFSAVQFRDAVARAAETWNDALREAAHRRPLTGAAIRYTGDCEGVESFEARGGNEINEIFVEPFDPAFPDRVGWTSHRALASDPVGHEADIRISPSLSAGCELRGVIMHEFGHALSFRDGGGPGDLMYQAYERCTSGPSAGEVTVLLEHLARVDLGRYRDLTVDGKLLGDADAPVRIVALEDFLCPYCGRFTREVIPVLEEEYISRGIVSIEYRHLPVILPAVSLSFAIGSDCAANQNLFWPYHDLLYRKRSGWGLTDLARGLNEKLDGAGLDLAEFDACLVSEAHREASFDAIRESIQLLRDLGAGQRLSVPTFIINGELWRVGLPPLQAFRDEIERVREAAAGGE